MSDTIKKVETFIQRLHNLHYVVSLEASKLWYAPRSSEYPFLLTSKRKNLADNLADAITDYQENKNKKSKLSYAKKLLMWINKAFTYGVIREGKSLISENKKFELDVKRLQERLDECNKRNQKLEKENKRLHGLVPPTSFVGDIK